MPVDYGIKIKVADEVPVSLSVADSNEALSAWGIRLWPMDLSHVSDEIQTLLHQEDLTENEIERVKAHFLLSRERLVELISAARKQPHVPGGGELRTYDATHGYYYPQLWVVQRDLDYSRFDRFHVNMSDDGTAVDEVMQMLSGSGIVIQHRSSSHGLVTLYLDCPKDDAGWMITYSGGEPHIGSASRAAPGTKILVQVIGPASWTMRYENDT